MVTIPGRQNSGSESGKNGEGAKKKRGRKKRRLPPAAAAPNMEDDDGYLGAGGMWGPEGHPMGDPGNKSKRARTSFKHNQLRIMRSHFQINQNPDSRELKMLSQKTGLDKKVLQVWFQNSRAKWRRSQSEGGGGAGNAPTAGESPGGSSAPLGGGGGPPPPPGPAPMDLGQTQVEPTGHDLQQAYPQEHYKQL